MTTVDNIWSYFSIKTRIAGEQNLVIDLGLKFERCTLFRRYPLAFHEDVFPIQILSSQQECVILANENNRFMKVRIFVMKADFLTQSNLTQV